MLPHDTAVNSGILKEQPEMVDMKEMILPFETTVKVAILKMRLDQENRAIVVATLPNDETDSCKPVGNSKDDSDYNSSASLLAS
jgi:hypothetical protein